VKIIVRSADLREDRSLLIEAAARYLTPLSDETRFNWLYNDNPHGQGRAWIAHCADHGDFAGAAAAFPRRIIKGDQEVVGWVLGDFCIPEQYRSLGPALQLQRTFLAAVDSGAAPFFYDFPSLRMMAVYRRLGISAWENMVRLAKPLRVNRKVKELVPLPGLAEGIAAFGNFVLWAKDRDWGKKHQGGAVLTLHEGPCGREFTLLADAIGSRYGICIHRSAEYLNWRYLAFPAAKHEIITAHREGTLAAYIVFANSEKDATLVDIFGHPDPDIAEPLIAAVVALLRERGVVTVSVPILEKHPWRNVFECAGFKKRESSPVVLYSFSKRGSSASMAENAPWLLMQGDRDW